MLVLKPRGRGNWHALTLAVEGAHLRVGDLVPLGGVVFRICKVLP